MSTFPFSSSISHKAWAKFMVPLSFDSCQVWLPSSLLPLPTSIVVVSPTCCHSSDPSQRVIVSCFSYGVPLCHVTGSPAALPTCKNCHTHQCSCDLLPFCCMCCFCPPRARFRTLVLTCDKWTSPPDTVPRVSISRQCAPTSAWHTRSKKHSLLSLLLCLTGSVIKE